MYDRHLNGGDAEVHRLMAYGLKGRPPPIRIKVRILLHSHLHLLPMHHIRLALKLLKSVAHPRCQMLLQCRHLLLGLPLPAQRSVSLFVLLYQ